MKVSVVVPAYNCAEYISKCVDSLLAQTYKNTEIIVVNDGSLDDTAKKLAVYGNKITLISKANGGAASARNAGLAAAGGDFVMFCDSDDFYDCSTVEKLLDIALKTKSDIVRSGYRIVYSDGRKELPKNRFTEYETVTKENFKTRVYPYFINGIMLNTTCGVLYSDKIVRGLKFKTNMKTGEDAAFNAEAFTKAEVVTFTPEVFYNYVRVKESLTGSALGITEKYRCNFMLSAIFAKKLNEWELNGIRWRIKTVLRPILLTFDKLARMKK